MASHIFRLETNILIPKISKCTNDSQTTKDWTAYCRHETGSNHVQDIFFATFTFVSSNLPKEGKAKWWRFSYQKRDASREDITAIFQIFLTKEVFGRVWSSEWRNVNYLQVTHAEIQPKVTHSASNSLLSSTLGISLQEPALVLNSLVCVVYKFTTKKKSRPFSFHFHSKNPNYAA